MQTINLGEVLRVCGWHSEVVTYLGSSEQHWFKDGYEVPMKELANIISICINLYDKEAKNIISRKTSLTSMDDFLSTVGEQP